MQRVVVRMRVSVGVKFVTEQRRRLRGRVQIEVVVVVSDVDAGRQRVVVSGRVLTVLLWTHGAVAWTQKTGGITGAVIPKNKTRIPFIALDGDNCLSGDVCTSFSKMLVKTNRPGLGQGRISKED